MKRYKLYHCPTAEPFADDLNFMGVIEIEGTPEQWFEVFTASETDSYTFGTGDIGERTLPSELKGFALWFEGAHHELILVEVADE